MLSGPLSRTIGKKVLDCWVLTPSQKTHINTVRRQEISGTTLWLFKWIKTVGKWTLWCGMLIARGVCVCTQGPVGTPGTYLTLNLALKIKSVKKERTFRKEISHYFTNNIEIVSLIKWPCKTDLGTSMAFINKALSSKPDDYLLFRSKWQIRIFTDRINSAITGPT